MYKFPSQNIRNIKNKQNWLPVIWGSGLLVNFTSNYFLIQRLGFIDAAYSTLLTYVFMAMFLVLKNRLWFPLSYNYMKILKVLLASLLVFIISSSSINIYVVIGVGLLYTLLIIVTVKNLFKVNYE